ncbi:hypothetical protein VTN31DRAFT_6873 [Thermomyces dupontii]|uniref:uncharacterized protein n=1 Tax=Talaromyces thermophilus TaxID=28565 RepID=UPI0037432AB2
MDRTLQILRGEIGLNIRDSAGGDPFLGPSTHTRRSSSLSNAEAFRLQDPPPLPARNPAEMVTPNRPGTAGRFPAIMATPTSEPYVRVNPTIGKTPTSFSTPGASDHERSLSLPPVSSSESDFESRSRAFAVEDIPRGFPPVAIAMFFNVTILHVFNCDGSNIHSAASSLP